MSLVSTYCLADDGQWYREPVLRGEDWFICFDDDDPPELVFKEHSDINPYTLLHDIGLKASLKGRGNRSGRMFGKDFEFDDAISFWLKIKKPIPAKAITEHDGVVTDMPFQGTLYDFGGGLKGLKQ